MNLGAVRVTERFGLDRAVQQDAVDAAIASIAADLSQLQGRPPPDVVVGMGGAVTNLAAVMLPAERREITGLQPARAEVILAGACIVHTVLATVGRRALIVSDRGLRHGVASERFARGVPQPQIIGG